MDDQDFDPLIVNKVFPEASAIFTGEFAPVASVLGEADFVLDTNVLLLPYGTGSDTLEQLESVYGDLASQGRLFVPGQVAREFAKWRPRKLADLVTQIENARTQNFPPLGNYPLLEELSPFVAARDVQEEIAALRKKLSGHLKELLGVVRAWSGDDPVSCLYRKHFKESCVIDPKLEEDEVKREFQWRMLHGIPPGNKDTSKADGGIGDFLIWRAVLEIGSKRKKPVVFISGDDKSDWRYQANKKGVYPRFELVDEYRRASAGMPFHILQFSEFLALQDAPSPVVAQVAEEEQRLDRLASEIDSPSRQLQAFVLDEYAESAVRRWLEADHDAIEAEQPFPDIVCLDSDGRRIGVEVLAVSDSRPSSVASLTRRMPNRARRAKSLIEEGALDEFLLVVVAVGQLPATTITEVKRLESHLEGPSMSVIVGRCGRDHEFRPVRT